MKPDHPVHTRCECGTTPQVYWHLDSTGRFSTYHGKLRRCEHAATCYLNDGGVTRWICPTHAAQLKRGKNPLKWWVK